MERKEYTAPETEIVDFETTNVVDTSETDELPLDSTPTTTNE